MLVSHVTERSFVRVLRLGLEAGLLGIVGAVALAVVLSRGAGLLGATVLVVAGPSMEPAIGRGTAIAVSPVEAADVRVGDVVSLRVGPSQAIVTHRVARVVDRGDGRWLETKGDANPGPDPALVPAAAVIGRVDLAVPLVGYLIAALALPSGLATAVGLCGVILVLLSILEMPLVPAPRGRPIGAKA